MCITSNNFRTSWRLAGALATGDGWPNVAARVVSRTSSKAIKLNRRYVILSPPNRMLMVCSRLLALAVERFQSQKSRRVSKLLFNPQQLIVFRDAVGA